MDSPNRQEDLGTYQMQWDCKFCGTTKLLGQSHRFCPNCGAAQDPASRYFPADDEKIAVEDHIYVGSDLICGSCSTPNSANSQNCRQCGAPLDNAEKASTLGEQVRHETETFESSGSRDIEKERFEAEMLRAGVTKEDQPKSKVRFFMIGCLVLVLLACGAILASTLITQDASVTVTGHEWNREIEIQQLSAVNDDAWCSSMPSGAYNVTRRREQRSTNRVPDGEDCSVRRVDNGDGTFREQRQCVTTYREEPVYDQRCYFKINRWVTLRSEVANGQTQSQTPNWPTVNLTQTGTCLGCQREGNRYERYLLIFRNNKDESTVECEVDESLWNSAKLNSNWKVEVNMLGVALCHTLEPS